MVTISLNFVDPDLDPWFVTETLNIDSNEQLVAGQEYTSPDFEEPQVSRVGKWTLTRLPDKSVGDYSSDLGEWCEFLQDRAASFEKMAQCGLYGYLELKFDNSEFDSVDLDAAQLDLLARLGLELSVWQTAHKSSKQQPFCGGFEFVCPQPAGYFSQLDERHFFQWLQGIECVKSVRGVGSELVVTVGVLTRESTLDFAALMTRYGIDLRALRPLANVEGGEWLGRLPPIFSSKVFEDSDDDGSCPGP